MTTDNTQGAGAHFCPQCGTPADPNSRFCANCGGALDISQAAPVPPPAVPPAAPVLPSYGAQPPAGYASQSAWAPPPAPPAPKSGGVGKCLIFGIAGVVGAILLACLGVGAYVAFNRDVLFPPAVPPTSTKAPATATATLVPPTATVPVLTSTPTRAPSATPTARPPTVTPTARPATATPTVKVVATATRTPAGLPGAVLFLDDFSSQEQTQANDWVLETGTNVDYAWAPGKYTITVKKADYLGYSWPDGIYTDFAAEVIAQSGGSSDADYGIVFKVSGESGSRSYYLFGVTTDGKYYVWARINGAWSDVDPVPSTISRFVKAPGNTLGVIVQGNKMSLYINRTLVQTFTDTQITGEGAVGVYVGTGAGISTYSASFTRYTVMTPNRALAEWGK